MTNKITNENRSFSSSRRTRLYHGAVLNSVDYLQGRKWGQYLRSMVTFGTHFLACVSKRGHTHTRVRKREWKTNEQTKKHICLSASYMHVASVYESRECNALDARIPRPTWARCAAADGPASRWWRGRASRRPSTWGWRAIPETRSARWRCTAAAAPHLWEKNSGVREKGPRGGSVFKCFSLMRSLTLFC